MHRQSDSETLFPPATRGSPGRSEVVSLRGPKQPGLHWNLACTLAGTISYLGANYLQLTAIAKLRGIDAVGEFAIANSWVLPVVALSQMQLRQLRCTDRPSSHAFRDYLTLRSWSSLLALTSLAIVVVFTGLDVGLIGLISVLALQRTFEAYSEVAYGEMQRADRMELIAWSQLLRSGSSIVAFAGLLYAGSSLLTACIILMLMSALSLLAFDLPIARRLSSVPEAMQLPFAKRQWSLVQAALPFALMAFVQTTCGQSSRFLLEHSQGRTQLAHFVVASAPLSMVTLLTGALYQSTLTQVAGHWHRREWLQFRKLCGWLTLLFVVSSGTGTIVFACFGPVLLEFLFTAEYRQSATALLIMAGGLNLMTLATGFSLCLIASRSSWLQFGSTACGLLALVAVGAVLIPKYGVIGAAWTEFARFAAIATYQFLAGTWVYQRRRAVETQSGPASVRDLMSLKAA